MRERDFDVRPGVTSQFFPRELGVRPVCGFGRRGYVERLCSVFGLPFPVVEDVLLFENRGSACCDYMDCLCHRDNILVVDGEELSGEDLKNFVVVVALTEFFILGRRVVVVSDDSAVVDAVWDSLSAVVASFDALLGQVSGMGTYSFGGWVRLRGVGSGVSLRCLFSPGAERLETVADSVIELGGSHGYVLSSDGVVWRCLGRVGFEGEPETHA